MSRLFIIHSSNDNVAAIAFKQWLGANGWLDVFLDLDDIGRAERWIDAFNNARARCEAVIFLASPDALSSPECLAEVRKAEDFGKEIIVVLLHDLTIDDQRLARGSFQDQQIVDLAAPAQDYVEAVDYRGERHEVRFNDSALASVRDFLLKASIVPDSFAWPPPNSPDVEPFPGLSAFTEDEAGIFFGRDSDILRGLDKLRVLRRDGRPRRLVIQGASGAGKSSYLRAGLWPRLKRDSNFMPLAILRPAQGILTGPEGLGRNLAAQLSRLGQFISPGEIHAGLMGQDAARASSDFTRLMATAAAQAHEQRRITDREARAPALLLAIDQAEELFGIDNKEESDRFLFLLAHFLRAPPAGVELFCLFTIRTDGAAQLFQTLAEMYSEVPETLPLLPLPQTSYRDVILKPLEVIARRGRRLTLSPELTDRLVADATGADALPLLALTISNLYREFGASGNITFAQYEHLGGMAGSIEMAMQRTFARPNEPPAIPTPKGEQLDLLRTAFIPWLVRVDPDTGLPMRRVARLDEFSQGARAMVERLVVARLLVTDRRSGVDVIEIAHESLLRQWPALTAWLQADAEDLELVDDIGRAARSWARNGRRDGWLDHRAERLSAAERITKREEFSKILGADGVAYLKACRSREGIEHSEASIWQLWRAILGAPKRIPVERPSPQPLGSKIFISYRRSDTRHIAGRLYDRLTNEILADEIFFDVDTIPIGVNFKDHISSAVRDSAVMLVLIGERWLDFKSKRWFFPKGREDYVQSEIELALDSGLPILPVLVDGVEMPRKEQLPISIAEIVFLNAASIRSGKDFRHDMDNVLDKIRSLRDQSKRLKG